MNTHKSTLLELEPNMGDRMYKAMKVRGLTNAKIADIMRIHPNSVSNWVHSKTMPRLRDLDQFAEIVGVTTQWIVTGEDPEMPSGEVSNFGDEDLVHPPGLEPGTHWLRVWHPQSAAELIEHFATLPSAQAESYQWRWQTRP